MEMEVLLKPKVTNTKELMHILICNQLKILELTIYGDYRFKAEKDLSGTEL